jgi:hypothetical protein
VTNDKQTAEEQARDRWISYAPESEVLSNMTWQQVQELKRAFIQAYVLGNKDAQEREKVIGRYWVLLKPGNVEHPVGTCVYSTEGGARSAASVEILGYVPTKVKLVEVEE